jgi:hypothetical protein
MGLQRCQLPVLQHGQPLLPCAGCVRNASDEQAGCLRYGRRGERALQGPQSRDGFQRHTPEQCSTS